MKREGTMVIAVIAICFFSLFMFFWSTTNDMKSELKEIQSIKNQFLLVTESIQRENDQIQLQRKEFKEGITSVINVLQLNNNSTPVLDLEIETLQEVICEKEEEIPNIVHLVKVDGNKYEFDFYHWLIVKGAMESIKPEKIYLHGDFEPFGDWWIKAKKYVEFRQVNVPTKTPKGKEIKEFQHKSDFVRLEVLYEFGGIYLDLDAIPLRSFERLRKCGFDQIFGRQKNDEIAVGLILTKKNNYFMKEFLKEAYEAFTGDWSAHSVKLLTKMLYSEKYNFQTLILDKNSFFPFGWEKPDLEELLYPGKHYYDWQLSYALHLFRSASTFRYNMLPPDGVSYVMTEITNFTRAVKWIVEKAIKDGEITWDDNNNNN